MNDHTNRPEVQSLPQEFPKLIRPRTEQPPVPNTKVTHIIDTGDYASTYANVRQLSEEKYKSPKQEFRAQELIITQSGRRVYFSRLLLLHIEI